jgi:hypothetical protein
MVWPLFSLTVNLFSNENVEESIMKKFLCFILTGFLAVSAFAGNVKITLNGKDNFVVLIDGKTYTPTTISSDRKEVNVYSLQTGQHTLEIFRTNNRGVNKDVYTSSFILGENESVHITVSANGAIKLEETTNNEAYGNTRTPMSYVAYNQLYKNVDSKRGQAEKYAEAKKVFNTSTNYFTVSQATEIIGLINSESRRLLLAKTAFDNLTDPSNYADMHSLFDLQTSIDDFNNYVRNNSVYANSNTNNYRVPMTDASYNLVYDDIRDEWLPWGQYTAATEAFNNASYNFTTAQVKKIIALISSESNRLELAKLAYDNITDTNNFRQLYDLFSSQASKDELDEFVRVNATTSY